MPIIKGTSSTPKKPRAPKEKAAQQFEMTMQVAGTEKAIQQSVGEGTYELVSGESSPSYGGWKSGTKQGKWESGGSAATVGPWESGAKTGGWAAGTRVGRWQAGGTATGGDGSRFENRTSDRTGDRYDGDGSRIFGRPDTVDLNVYERDEGGFVGGGGGGGTGSPQPGLSSAVAGLGLKSADLSGRSVEEVIARGARKTKKTGARRTQ